MLCCLFVIVVGLFMPRGRVAVVRLHPQMIDGGALSPRDEVGFHICEEKCIKVLDDIYDDKINDYSLNYFHKLYTF